MPETPNPLIDLVEIAKQAADDGKIEIDPKKYGYDNPDDYWRDMRRLAGIPPLEPSATDPPLGVPIDADTGGEIVGGEPRKPKPFFGMDRNARPKGSPMDGLRGKKRDDR